MNPFTLPGPAFLKLYLVLSIAVILVTRWKMRSSEPEGALRVSLRDSYAIAYLRGGAGEALRVATFSLIDRGLLRVDGSKVVKAANVSESTSGLRPMEQQLLTLYRVPQRATVGFSDPKCRLNCQELSSLLRERGLLADEAVYAARRVWFHRGLAVLLGVAGIKWITAVSTGHHNVEFLIILAAIGWLVLHQLYRRERTRLGDQTLSALRALLGRLRDRREAIKPGGATEDAALLAAVFGLMTLPRASFAYVRQVFPQGSDSSGGSGCGSSGCGSGCGGGGGCGGCGS